ncbi:MAG: ROK family protein [Gammaproteobacteria bacterium]|nr:ROK family protein [Gammaproteobacteria bacterium]
MRIGIDLGGTKTEGAVMDAGGKILFRERRPTPAAQGYEAILNNIHDIVRHLEAQTGVPCAVGIGTPGAVSTRTGTLKNSNTTCLIGKPIRDDLEKSLDRPVRIANDANCFALSEALDGAGKGEPVVFGVIMGTGVGGGIVVNSQLIEGLQHIAGEWGHNCLEPNGPRCYCGKLGCVETFLSGPGLARDYAAHGGKTGFDAETIAAVAQDDAVAESANGPSLARGPRLDPVAEAAMHRYLDRFGRALAVVINILDPHVIVLGGGMSNIRRLYTEGREHVARHVFNDELRTKILPNVHGDSSGVRGAAQLWPADHGLL